jgi:hypothetical protein
MDRYTVYAVGDGGVAICSFDEGIHWFPMVTGTATNLAGVSASPYFNLATGASGAILKVH